ncbi:MAG: DUF2752 domain-containing protein [Tannerellaceae bacterium]|nr:DUF2752 domain-containing protein [Tannerellaceae bacterium]
MLPPEFLRSGHSLCLIKNLWGRECYGCGITRAIVAAVQLDFEAAYHYNRLVTVVLPLFVYVWAKTLVKLWGKGV